MKRSRSVKLTLMGATAVTLSSCGEPQENVTVFKSISECATAGYNQQVCEEQYSRALRSHLSTAPKYAAEADCETDFGKDKCEARETDNSAQLLAQLKSLCEGNDQYSYCEDVKNGKLPANVAPTVNYVPLMAAFMMALPRSATPGYRTSSYYYGRPLYFPSDGSGYRTVDNRPVSKSTGEVTVAKSTVTDTPNVRTSTIKRGGFGQRAYSAASRSSGRSGGFSFGG